MPKAKKTTRALGDEQLWTFASDALDFCGDGIWIRFLASMKELGYSEDEVNEFTDSINSRAGRS